MLYIDDTLKQKHSLYEQIYIQIKDDILRKVTRSGSRLPSTRSLAKELGVGRNTVITAYHQLELEGYVYSVKGAGFYVNQLSANNFPDISNAFNMSLQYRTKEKESKYYKYDFHYGSIETNIFPMKQWRKCLMSALDYIASYPTLAYMEKQGDIRLRSAIASYLYRVRGVNTNPDRVIVTSGHQQSLEIITQLLSNLKYSFLMEEPGYDGTRVIFEKNDYQINHIPVEEDGIHTDGLSKQNKALLYITPSHQFPTGCILSIKKRLSLLSWADESDSYIIEDDYDSEIRYHMLPIPSLQSLDTNDRTIYLGTFSKSLSPDLRVSYMVLPKSIYDIYDKGLHTTSCMVPRIIQLALSDFIQSGMLEKHHNVLRTYYKKKYEQLTHTIKQVFKQKADIKGSEAGLHLLLHIHSPLKREDWIKRAYQAGVIVYSVDNYWNKKKNCPKNQILIGYGGISIKDIPKAIQLLYEAIFDSEDLAEENS